MVEELADVTTLVEDALPQHMLTAGGTPPSRPSALPANVVPLPRTTVPFPQREDGIVILDFSRVYGSHY